MTGINLSARLSEVASYVREGAVLADVGTDHAYLPLYLLLSGKIKGAVASDVRKGPLERAREHISLFPGLSDKIETVLCDGLSGIGKYSPTDISICGMGGELIAEIIDKAPFTKSSEINLILQPMTMEHKLRRYLSENGYEIKKESIVAEGNKLYQIMLASYSGKSENITEVEALLGKYNIEHRTKELSLLVKKHMKALKKQIDGRSLSGRDVGDLKILLETLERDLDEEHR